MTLSDAKKLSILNFNDEFEVDQIIVKDRDGNKFTVEFYEEGIEIARNEKTGEDENEEDIYSEEAEISPFYEYPMMINDEDEVEYLKEDYNYFEYILIFYIKHGKFPNP